LTLRAYLILKVSHKEPSQNSHHWIVIGTNFTKADTQVRSHFAITQNELADVYQKATNLELKDFFVLSTCNRTEFYGCASLPVMRELVADQLNLEPGQLEEFFYTITGYEAIRHLFKVVAGLNSQIIGDYEIVGQVKKAVQLSREFGMVQTLTDRITSYAFQASKEIKVKTNLSQGKYSVSYAAAELITAYRQKQAVENILIVGTGEMGQAVARNLKEYFPHTKLFLTNRTKTHAQQLADELHADVVAFEKFTSNLNTFDVIITTAESNRYLICANDLPENCACLFLDLSIPQVIDPQLKNLPLLTHYSVDEISHFHNELMKQRHLEVPKAEQIIEDFIIRLREWQYTSQYTGVILSYKEKMERIIHKGGNPTHKIEKSFSGLIRQIKSEGYHGCSVIQTMNDLIALEKLA
jgi:glutamyl-tRNA reductase